jgi:molybdenum cofactor guanylyltransferase
MGNRCLGRNTCGFWQKINFRAKKSNQPTTMHEKHTKLSKPHQGFFARNEWSLMGTNCTTTQQLAKDISACFSIDYKVGYMDASHKIGESEIPFFHAEWIDKIKFQQQEQKGKYDPDERSVFFNEVELVFVNGNHFKAQRQIVVLDPKKMESLARNAHKLTQIEAFLVQEDSPKVLPDFLKQKLLASSQIPFFKITETAKIADFVVQKSPAPKVQGLILAGGYSTRMGTDKGSLNWNGKAQREYLYDLLQSIGIQSFISCRDDQKEQLNGYPSISDTFLNLGPMGAIMSAFRENPTVAWLVIACDLPFLDQLCLEFLIKNRNASAVATAFKSPTSTEGFPEPLATIWEPKSYQHLLRFLSQGVSCPRKVLINSETHLIETTNSAWLRNVNTKADFLEAEKLIALNFDLRSRKNR